MIKIKHFAYVTMVLLCTFSSGYGDPPIEGTVEQEGAIQQILKVFSETQEFAGKTIEVTISSSDKIRQNTVTADFDLQRGTYKMVSHANNPASKIPKMDLTIIGDLSTAYQKLDDKADLWIPEPSLAGLNNRLNRLTSQLQLTTSPVVKGFANTFNGYIHLYSNTDKLEKLPQYVEALKALDSKTGFSISTETEQIHCVVNNAGLITHLDCRDTSNYDYELDVKVAQSANIEFPPGHLLNDETKQIVSQIKKPIFGFAVGIVGGTPTIAYAVPGSSYIKAGGQMGDKVLKIDDESLQNLSESGIEKILEARDHVKLTIIQNGAVKILDIQRTNILPQ